MINLGDIIPQNMFSVSDFTAYATNMRRKEAQWSNENEIAQTKMEIGGFMFSYTAYCGLCFLVIAQFSQSMYLVFGSAIACLLPALATAAALASVSRWRIARKVAKEQQELTSTLAPWQQQYHQAWNNIIAPQMMHTLTSFDSFSTNVSPSNKCRPEYIKMIRLSEDIRQQIAQEPTLNTNTDLTQEPNFIALNAMMDHYQSWQAA